MVIGNARCSGMWALMVCLVTLRLANFAALTASAVFGKKAIPPPLSTLRSRLVCCVTGTLGNPIHTAFKSITHRDHSGGGALPRHHLVGIKGLHWMVSVPAFVILAGGLHWTQSVDCWLG
jgi:hypothetical protein